MTQVCPSTSTEVVLVFALSPKHSGGVCMCVAWS